MNKLTLATTVMIFLLLVTVTALDIEKGTMYTPSSANVTFNVSNNITGIQEIEVSPFRLTIDNVSVFVSSEVDVVISFNWSSVSKFFNNTNASNNVTIHFYNMSNYHPYNDAYEPDGGTIIQANINDYNMTLANLTTVAVGGFLPLNITIITPANGTVFYLDEPDSVSINYSTTGASLEQCYYEWDYDLVSPEVVYRYPELHNTTREVKLTADAYTCVGNFNASHPCTDFFDDDYDTWAENDTASDDVTIDFNFTRPIGALGGSRLSIHDGLGLYNFTFNSTECFELPTIQFRAETASAVSSLSCRYWQESTSSYVWDAPFGLDLLNHTWYEFTMYWNMTKESCTNFTLDGINGTGLHNLTMYAINTINRTANHSIQVRYINGLFAEQLSPANDTLTNNQTMNFRCNATVNGTILGNMTLDVYKAGSPFFSNETAYTSPYVDWEVPGFTGDNYTWACTIWDDNHSFSNTTVNRTLNVVDVRIGYCNASFLYPILNISHFDEATDAPVNATNGYNMQIAGDALNFNLIGSFTNFTQRFCMNVDPATQVYNFSMWGTFTLSAPEYTTRIVTIDSAVPYYLTNLQEYSLNQYLIKIDNSSTISFTWLSKSYHPLDGTMRIYTCNPDGSTSLVESTPVVSGEAVANLQLLVQPYSYDIVIDGEVFEDDSYTTCHIESKTERTFYVDLLGEDVSDTIGMLWVDCSVLETGLNEVTMNWSGNTEDDSNVTGCIVAYRQTIYDRLEIYRNCSDATPGSIVRTVPSNFNSYFVTGEISQGSTVLYCNDVVSFYTNTDAETAFSITGLFGAVLIIAAIALLFSGSGVGMIIGTIIGVVGVKLLGIVALSPTTVGGIVAFLILIIFIARYSKHNE